MEFWILRTRFKLENESERERKKMNSVRPFEFKPIDRDDINLIPSIGKTLPFL